MNLNATQLKLTWICLLCIDLIWIWFLYKDTQIVPTEPDQACFSLIDSKQKQYYQWSSQKDHPPFEKGQWRWNKTPPYPLPYPKIRRLKQDNANIHYLSQGAIPKEGSQLIIYDDWSQIAKLKNPLRPISDTTLQTVIFIDQSATMNNPWGHSKGTAYEVLLRTLQQKRNVSSNPWEIITFGSNWNHHGTWRAQQNFSIHQLGSPLGKTKWSEALEGWLKTKPAASQIIMLGDGKIEERNIDKLKKTLEVVKQEGHQIISLSPNLTALKNWEGLYQTQLVSSHWPETQTLELNSEVSSLKPFPAKWSKVTAALAGSNHLPLLWSSDGYLLVSYESRESGPLYHFAGIPNMNPTNLLEELQKNNQQDIFLEIRTNHLVIDFQSDSKAPLQVKSSQGEKLIWPENWGIYKLAQFSDRLQFAHPEYGIFKIEQLNSFQKAIFHQAKKSPEPSLAISEKGLQINLALALGHFIVIILTTLQIRQSLKYD